MTRTLCLNLSRRTIIPAAGEEMWDAREAARRLRGFRAAGALLRYDEVRLHLDDIEDALSPLPLAAARLLSRGSARLVDGAGRTRLVSWGELAAAAWRGAAHALAWPGIRRSVFNDLAEIGAPAALAPGRGGGALVVRSDLWFGLEAGGAVAHTAGVLNALAERRPVRLLSSHPVPMLSSRIERIEPQRRRRGLPRSEWSLLAFNGDLAAAGARLEAPAYVYQRHSLYGYAGALLARRWGAPLVLEYNGSEVWTGDHWGTPVRARDIAVEIERRMLGAAHLVTVVSKPLVEQAIALGARPERVALCPNAADTDIYSPAIDGASVRARHGLGASLVIGFIGTFGAWHGASLLAAAFADAHEALPADADVRLLMVGDGPDQGAARAAIAAARLEGRAVFAGLVPQSEGPAHLAAADILVSPTLPNPDGSAFFGSPTKLFEYMAMGRAIVASNLAQLGEILEDGKTALLVPPADRAALSRALVTLVADHALRQRLAHAARAEAVARHQWRHRAALIEGELARLGAL